MKNPFRKAALAVGLSSIFALSALPAQAQSYRHGHDYYGGTPDPRCDSEDTLDKALGGAVAGALLGGLLGDSGRDATNGAALGAAIGALSCNSLNQGSSYGGYRHDYRSPYYYDHDIYSNRYRYNYRYQEPQQVCYEQRVVHGYDRWHRPIVSTHLKCFYR